MIKKYILLFLSISLIITSCGKNRHENFGRDLAKAFKIRKYKNFDTSAYYAVFKDQLAKHSTDLHNPKSIAKIYTSEDKGLTLIGDFLIKGQLDTLVDFLAHADEHGLNPQYFHVDELKSLLIKAKTFKFKKVNDAYPVLANIELLSADGLINYANFMKYGAINPKELFSRYYVSVDRPDIVSAEKSLDQLNLTKFLNSLTPKDEAYLNLHRILVQDKEAPKLSYKDKAKIYYSMERLRWRTEAYPEEYLLVNIPEFKLRLYNNKKEKFEMKVCVGEAADGESNHQTPILSGLITTMQINPVWNIPKSIAVNEIAASLRSNSNYLEEKNMVAYRYGNLVDASEVDWSTADASEYSFKQNPGVDNSLGQIKFIFKNSYAIYLHDTPAQAAFAQENRAVSHGCVRVEKPMLLAQELVKDSGKANEIQREIDEANSGQSVNSRWVKVKSPVPVFIEYYTAWVNAKGNLVLSNDIYNYDRVLYNAFAPYMAR